MRYEVHFSRNFAMSYDQITRSENVEPHFQQQIVEKLGFTILKKRYLCGEEKITCKKFLKLYSYLHCCFLSQSNEDEGMKSREVIA